MDAIIMRTRSRKGKDRTEQQDKKNRKVEVYRDTETHWRSQINYAQNFIQINCTVHADLKKSWQKKRPNNIWSSSTPGPGIGPILLFFIFDRWINAQKLSD